MDELSEEDKQAFIEQEEFKDFYHSHFTLQSNSIGMKGVFVNIEDTIKGLQ